MNPMGQMMGGMMQNMMGQMMQGVMMQMMSKLGMPNMANANPQQMMSQIMNNPQVQSQAGALINGKSQQQLNETFTNLCKERGIDPAQFAQQMGVSLPQ